MDSSSLPAIEVKNCSKRYQYMMAVNNVNLKVDKGEIIGFIGPNGAGKTTLLNMIAGVVKPSRESQILYNGRNLRGNNSMIRNMITLFSYHSFFYDDLTGLENLEFWLKLYNTNKLIKNQDLVKKIIETASRYGMKHWLSRPISELSTGMRKKVEFLRILLAEPEIVLLDEPFSGLDPNNIEFLTDLVKDIGCTVCIVSHNLKILSEVCEKVYVLNKGKISNILDIKDLKSKGVVLDKELKKYFEIKS